LLSALIHFFEHGCWGFLEQMDTEGEALTAKDQLFILMQAGLYLTATRGFAAPEALICYERAESLCVSLNQPLVLFSALRGLWRYSACSRVVIVRVLIVFCGSELVLRMWISADSLHNSELALVECQRLAVGRGTAGTSGVQGCE
jgi:hypothetical protein